MSRAATTQSSKIFVAGVDPDRNRMMSTLKTLSELGVLPADEYPSTDLDIGDESADVRARLREVIQAASAVIVVWNDSTAHSPRLNYQIGLADALEKPITVVISREKLNNLPPILQSARIVKVDAGLAPTHNREEVSDRPQLTLKEVEVLSLAVHGLPNKRIAAELKISQGTIRAHLSAIYRKLNVQTRGEAIALGHRLEGVPAQHMRQSEHGSQILDWLLPHMTYHRCGKGDVIFRKGDPGGELYYIQSGIVVLEEIGKELERGDMFGEVGVFASDHRRTVTARCKTEVDLVGLNSEQAKSIYYLNPEFALTTIRLIWTRLIGQRKGSGR